MSTALELQVPFLDLAEQNRRIRHELQPAIEAVIDQCQFILGPAVARFEAAFSDYIGRRYCVGVNNGTSALHLALRACDIGPGDEVITTPHSWISTSWAISYVGARPVFVDIDPQTYTLSADLVEQAITPRTKALLPVHLYGQACNIEALQAIANRYGLTLIEDAAQAHGALCDGRRVGSFGRIACFSFYPGKNLGAFGEGGAIVTDDSRIAERIRQLRDHAQAARHQHVELGYNMRLEGLQAAVLEVKLRHLDAWNAARQRHAQRYQEILADLPGVTLPTAANSTSHVWHLFVVLVPGHRDRLQKRLAELGVSTAVHYPTPIHLQPAYAHLGYKLHAFPVAEDVTQRCLSLPMYPELDNAQIDHVGEALRTALGDMSDQEVFL